MISSQYLLAEVARRSGHGVDGGHYLLVGNYGIGSIQQHLGVRGGWGTVHTNEGAAGSELERARR
jgi:hypothetical protein